jgi:hypothetical protein
MYFFYAINILKIYMIIKNIHGVYVSYIFLKWSLGIFYSQFIYFISYTHKPFEQIDDRYQNYINIDDYIFIY